MTRPPACAQPPAPLPGRVAVEVAGDDVGAGFGQPAHDLRAEPAAGARHDGAPPRREISSASVRSLTSGTITGGDYSPGLRVVRRRSTIRPTMSERDADAIRRLLHAYGDAVLARDADAWGELWTEDGVWELGPGRVIEGREAIVEHWRTSIANYRHVVQLYLSSTATIDGDAAAGRGLPRRAQRAGRRRPPGAGRMVRRRLPAHRRRLALLAPLAHPSVRRRARPRRAVLRLTTRGFRCTRGFPAPRPARKPSDDSKPSDQSKVRASS